MSQFFWSNFFKDNSNKQQIISDYWAQTPLFMGIPNSQIYQLVSTMHIRQFAQGESIFKQGDQGAGALLIIDGHVNVSTKETALASLKSGDFFGEIALAQTDQRTADATAVENTELVFFLKQDVEEWIAKEPTHGAQFLKNLAAVLARRLQKMNDQLNTYNSWALK